MELALGGEGELGEVAVAEGRSGQEAKNCEGEPENRLILSGFRLARDSRGGNLKKRDLIDSLSRHRAPRDSARRA